MKILDVIVGLEDIRAYFKEWSETDKKTDKYYLKVLDEAGKILSKEQQNNRYSVEEFLDYLKRNDIILVNADQIGDVELPETNEEFILDDDKDNCIIP